VISRYNPIKIAALITAIAFSTTAAYGQQIIGADHLVLSGQVYTPINGWRTPFEGSLAVVSEPPGGTGVIAAGQLSFIFGRPSTLEPLAHVLANAVRGWGDLVISPPGAMGAQLTLRTPEAGMTISQNATFEGGMSGGRRTVYYIFVDRDVAISGRRRIENTSDRDDREWIEDHMAFNIILKMGWNILYRSTRERWDEMGNGESTTTLSQDITEWAVWMYHPENAIPFFN